MTLLNVVKLTDIHVQGTMYADNEEKSPVPDTFLYACLTVHNTLHAYKT